MTLNEKQSQLYDFVKLKHKDQKRKYSGEPYHNHLFEVAYIVAQAEPSAIEIALCHDLFEDTNCNFTELHKRLTEIGYEHNVSYDICTCVKELTDVFTKKDYPHLNRAKRKEKENERLSKISYLSQTVKYADIIDNTNDILEHDENFAKIYIKEVLSILNIMNKGNKNLFITAQQQALKNYMLLPIEE